MRYILYLFLITLTSISLLGGTKAKIVNKEGSMLIIDKGLEDGVKIGMKGLVQKRVQGEAINLGIFIVKSVAQTTSDLFIEKASRNAKIEFAVQVEFYNVLIPQKMQLTRLKQNIDEYLKKKKSRQAAELIKTALEIEPGDEELIKLAQGVALLNSVFSVDDYISYRTMHPGSPILRDLKEKLYTNYLNLPPQKFLDLALRLKMNSKGYFEIEFENYHTMLYVKEMKLFVDKYEVSNAHFLKFADKNNIDVNSIYFSTLEGYPRSNEGYPAIVSYEDAKAYCNAIGMRLPTEDEWEMIAGKNKGTEYSWGDQQIDAAGIYRANFESLNDGFIEVAPVKSFEKYSSPVGAINIMGNVQEWVKGKICKGGGYLSEKEELTFKFRLENCIRAGFRCVLEANNNNEGGVK